jgi:ABC-type branched-subunit amino acid transport system permease subunit
MTTFSHYAFVLASAYGSGAYGAQNYNGTGGGSLTDTGIAVGAIVGGAALILLATMAVRIWKRPAKKRESKK